MKKFTLIIGISLVIASCDSSPGGNRDILPVVHEEAVEPVDHHGEEAHEEASHENHHAEPHDTATIEKDVHAATPEKDVHAATPEKEVKDSTH